MCPILGSRNSKAPSSEERNTYARVILHTVCIHEWAEMKNAPLHLACPHRCVVASAPEELTVADEEAPQAAANEPGRSSAEGSAGAFAPAQGSVLPDDVGNAMESQLRAVETEMAS